ncbi:MAG TPA: hypothetical protein VNU95_00790 [Candidatus Acidoferrales bacterium]|jgi:hypothetical protein|nr:hypothetical protein [Candidatus Acidoferrales bacterium]
MRFLALLLILVSLPAVARLGETNVQIWQRYGRVQKRYDDGTNLWHAGYLFKDYAIIVYYTNNISEAECVSPVSARTISDDERKELMKDIGGDGNWASDGGHLKFGPDCWTNSNGAVAVMAGILADTPDSYSMLAVGTRSYFDQMVAKMKHKDAASGF